MLDNSPESPAKTTPCGWGRVCSQSDLAILRELCCVNFDMPNSPHVKAWVLVLRLRRIRQAGDAKSPTGGGFVVVYSSPVRARSTRIEVSTGALFGTVSPLGSETAVYITQGGPPTTWPSP